jgi:ubiquinone/menaquinone biosynthesis C-methylase UbiE
MEQQHTEQIRDQFTRQAVPFSSAAEIRNEDWLTRIVQMAQAGPADTVLDVACGPGLLACAFARVATHVTGIDTTPKMLEQARAFQQQLGLDNLTWHEGEVPPLPYPDAAFSLVATRFAFHHFLEPLEVLKEMRRVCCGGGRIVVVDSAPALEKAEAFNRMERLRDPSHVRALPTEDLVALFAAAGLPPPRVRREALPYELDSFLARSFPKEGDADRIRDMFAESLANDMLGVSAVRRDGKVHFCLPTVTLVSAIPLAERSDRGATTADVNF